MSLDLNKLANKLDEALSNETSETLTKFLTDKRMSNNKQTPQEKAEELYLGYWYLTNDSRIAKQCAIIAVNEILNINCVDKDVELSDYWEEVKQEIENL